MTPHNLPHFDRCVRTAEFSPCRQYRWWLRRDWGDNHRVITFLMLNPSLGNERADDPTIRRCMWFARSWGYGALAIRNLYAFISPSPDVLFKQLDPIGSPRNDVELLAALRTETVVCAWGAHARPPRVAAVLALFATHAPDKALWCFGQTKGGAPRHPLYLSNLQPLEPYMDAPPVSRLDQA